MHPNFHRFIPTREQINQNRWLRWLGPRLMHPRLWHFSRRSVAVGVGLGVFFGLLIPIAQIPFAAGTAVLMRANVPVAIGSTLVTNPLTFAPVYVLAHRLGATILGDTKTDVPDITRPITPVDDSKTDRWKSAQNSILALGKPLLLGLSILAVSISILTYAMIMLFWRIKISRNWKQRKKSRQ